MPGGRCVGGVGMVTAIPWHLPWLPTPTPDPSRPSPPRPPKGGRHGRLLHGRYHDIPHGYPLQPPDPSRPRLHHGRPREAGTEGCYMDTTMTFPMATHSNPRTLPGHVSTTAAQGRPARKAATWTLPWHSPWLPTPTPGPFPPTSPPRPALGYSALWTVYTRVYSALWAVYTRVQCLVDSVH